MRIFSLAGHLPRVRPCLPNRPALATCPHEQSPLYVRRSPPV